MIRLRLLVTRPEGDAARTAAELRARGHDVLLAPLLRMEAVERASLGQGSWSGVLVTSANAVRSLRTEERAALQNAPLLAVGERTAAEARAAGFARVVSADGDAIDLARLAAATFAGAAAPLIYFAAEDRAHDLATTLAAHGIALTTVATYRMEQATRFPEQVIERLLANRIDGVLHYSHRSADAYLACADAPDLRSAAVAPTHFCLSGKIAERLAAVGARDIRSAQTPDEAALLKLLDF